MGDDGFPVLRLRQGQSIDDALRLGRQAGFTRLDAQLLLGHALGLSRTALLAHCERALTANEAESAQALFERRQEGVPVAYLVGQREFHGLTLRVDRHVLDPRPDTETLVDWALECASSSVGTLIDLGTGSGAIALAFKARRAQWSVHASDASPQALAVARANAQALALEIEFHAGSWWSAAQGRRFALAVSNPPYIAEDDPHLQSLRHEPRMALVAQEHGLADLQAIIVGAHGGLEPGGWLLLEHGCDQAQAVGQMLARADFRDITHRKDIAGHTRCTGGRLAG